MNTTDTQLKDLKVLIFGSVVKIVIQGHPDNGSFSILRAAELRRICPDGMNTELSFPKLFQA